MHTPNKQILAMKKRYPTAYKTHYRRLYAKAYYAGIRFERSKKEPRRSFLFFPTRFSPLSSLKSLLSL